MEVINVLKPTKYNIYIGKNIAYRILERFTFDKVLILADDNLPSLDIENIQNAFTNAYVYLIKASEANKSLETVAQIYDILLEENFGKNDYILAFGGGIVCDLAGYVAATFKRGIKIISLPTTLLAMIDASIGSKVAINHGNIKNAVGTFYSPEMVIIDEYYLKSLPARQINNGLMEAYKMGLTLDKNILDAVNNNDFSEIISLSIKAKVNIVNIDPFDKLERHVLNFGHSIGHALELLDNDIYHGEAVAIGMIFMTRNLYLKEQMKTKFASYFDVDKYINYVKENTSVILEKIANDKKNINSTNAIIKDIILNDLESYEIKSLNMNDLRGILNE